MICPALDVAGVNLSVGYSDAHGPEEELDLSVVERTEKIVKRIIEEQGEAGFYGYHVESMP